MSATPKEIERVQRKLQRIGWPIRVDGQMGAVTRAAIKDFKRGWNKGKWYDRLNGNINDKLLADLTKCLRAGGKCSAHFTYREFKSKGNGWIRVNRSLLRALEKYRRKFGPIGILSPYRDPAHNVAVGGASLSQHTDIVVNGKVYLGGNATDFTNPGETLEEVRDLNLFSGIGVKRATGLVLHVDVRHAKGGFNTTGGTPADPTVWYYD